MGDEEKWKNIHDILFNICTDIEFEDESYMNAHLIAIDKIEDLLFELNRIMTF